MRVGEADDGGNHEVAGVLYSFFMLEASTSKWQDRTPLQEIVLGASQSALSTSVSIIFAAACPIPFLSESSTLMSLHVGSSQVLTSRWEARSQTA